MTPLPLDQTSGGVNGRRYAGMQRTTLLIPNDLRDRLRQIAAERGVSMATIVREALEERVARAHPTPRSLGAGTSGSTGTAMRTGPERPEPRVCL